MEVQTVLRMVLVLVLVAGLSGARAVDTYFTEGGKLVVEPKVAAKISNILWKHNGNLLAEWVEDAMPLTYYNRFKGRTALDVTTGRLEVTTATKDDAGAYTLEINSKVHGESFTAKVIKEVPTPSVWIQPVACTPQSESCTLLCEGRTPQGDTEDTTGAEPITYSWREDGGDWTTSGKDRTINKETAGIEKFSCQMKNPVSTKESQPHANPFYVTTPPPTASNDVGGIVGGVLGVLAVVGFGIVAYFKREALKSFLCAARDDESKADYENVPINESPKTDDVNAPPNETPKTDDVNAPPNESPKTDDVNAPPNESPKTDDVTVSVNESPKTDDATATAGNSH
ncbi:hypothetical protein D5F01_LYC21532 [Larimichthys crocea]|uniref:Ig-like domain-containing protein n=1 Tax=Larimichthys crocea TaxID=215358 RepID=A0A6G0HP61_LARCR|nr:hypothetical protein D5F01_LYC21532 [Larimichthys crocea]